MNTTMVMNMSMNMSMNLDLNYKVVNLICHHTFLNSTMYDPRRVVNL